MALLRAKTYHKAGYRSYTLWPSDPDAKYKGSFENEAIEHEDRSTKHPNLENEAPKTRKWSTQYSKTNHPRLENEAPKTRKRSTHISKLLYVEGQQL